MRAIGFEVNEKAQCIFADGLADLARTLDTDPTDIRQSLSRLRTEVAALKKEADSIKAKLRTRRIALRHERYSPSGLA
jgi:hypothetical protein